MNEKLDALYISIDVESDGPTPGVNNLLSVGAVAFYNQEPQETFEANLDLLPYCAPNETTMRDFWNKNEKHKALYQQTRENTVGHIKFAQMFVDFCERQVVNSKHHVVFVAAPASYDHKWIDYELQTFYRYNPFGHSQCLDMRSVVFGRMDLPFYKVGKRQYPKEWFPEQKHTHVAVEDALEQGQMFMNMIKWYDERDREVLRLLAGKEHEVQLV